MTIRSYEPADLEAVWDLHHVALEATGAHLGDSPWYDDLKDIAGVYLNNHGSFLVGLVDGHIRAMGALQRTEATRAQVRRMRVHLDFQGRGFGTLLLTALEAEARRLKYRILHLDTTEKQVMAQKLYQKFGYLQTGTGKVGHIDVLLFEKSLA